MLTIEDNTISLTRGDTGYINLALDTEVEGTITLSCKKDYDSEDYLFQKIVPVGETIILEPKDTKELEYGKYVYDIQIDTVDGEVFTVVGPANFKITKEVTV